MNIQQLKYCIAVADNQGFGSAAKELFVGQSTLSTMIAKLEGELGIQIFDRRYKPVEITREGADVIAQARIIINEVDNLQVLSQQLKGEMGGKIHIGVIPTVAPYLLPLFIGAASSRLSTTQILVSELTTDEIIKQLIDRNLDMGILSTPLHNDNLLETELYTEPFHLYDGSGLMKKSKVDPHTLDCNRLWLMDEGHCLRQQVATVCDLRNQQVAERNLEYKSGSIDTLMRFVRRHRGLTLLPHLAIHDLNHEDKTKLRKFKSPVPSRAIGIVTHRHFKKANVKTIIQEEIQKNIRPLLPRTSKDKVIVDPLIN